MAAFPVWLFVFLIVSVKALNSNLKFFSVWELESVQPKDALGWTNFLFTSANVSQLKEWSEAGVGPSLLYVYNVFFSDGMLRPDYESSWSQTFSILEPLLKSKAAMGVFLGDELAWSCIPFSNISAAADLVRLSIPRGSGIIYYNEAFPPFVPDGQGVWKQACPNVYPLIYPRQVGLGFHDRLNESSALIVTSLFRVPSSLDWISIDYYPGTCLSLLSMFLIARSNTLPLISSPPLRRRCHQSPKFPFKFSFAALTITLTYPSYRHG
jgi:hypothetical protein